MERYYFAYIKQREEKMNYKKSTSAIRTGQNLSEQMLTREEEAMYGKIIQESSPKDPEYIEAHNKLVECNLRLVAKEAHIYSKKCNTEIEDIMNEGVIGLLMAVERFDPDKCPDTSFASYALYWIRQRMGIYTMENNTIRIPKNVGSTISKYGKIKKEFGDKITREEIMTKLDLTDTEMNSLERAREIQVSSISENTGNDGFDDSQKSLEDILPDDHNDPFDDCVDLDRAKFMEKILEEYSDRDKDILMSQYFSEDPKTLKEIGEKYKLSRERIRQIKFKLLWSLKKKIQKLHYELPRH